MLLYLRHEFQSAFRHIARLIKKTGFGDRVLDYVQ